MDNARRTCISAISLFSLFACTTLLSAQSRLNQNVKTKQVAWQQRVDHKITATLDTATQSINATEIIKYTNNSPNVLNEIWFHIWPNAFKDNSTGYGKEAILHGNQKYFNAPQKERGYIDGLDFKVNGMSAKWEYHPQYNDIIRVILPAPIESGTSAEIITPFHVKLPWLFSRMGVNQNIYAITQWYPKPAVYDVNGWNVFPYQDQGEYYSEFGTYDVDITVPSKFRVGATGKLLDETEWEWLEQLSKDPADDDREDHIKTLHYHQDNVPDFAWFASPDYLVKIGKVTLSDNRVITTLAFEKNMVGKKNIKKSTKADPAAILEDIEKALKYYSRRVGIYPYDYCTVVIGPLQGAGGMEYPMITICGDKSSETIVHEVGHNWFQCMLGSQERNFPWMDESINTFYHTQATSEKDGEFSPGDKINPSSELMQFKFTHDIGLFQSGTLHASEYHPFNYGTIVYAANPRRFMYLQEYLGRVMFDSCMKTYFKKWQFKHPLPEDIQASFEQVSKQDLDWFFKGLLSESAPDFAIQSVRKTEGGYKVKVNNKGRYALPVKLSSRRETVREDIWLKGNDTTVIVKGVIEQISLNPSGYLTESNFANNDSRTKGIFKTRNAIKIGFPSLYQRGTSRVWIFPNVFASNHYDGFMPGLIISSFNVPRRNWEWWALPMYGVKSKSLTGIASLQRNIYHKNGPLAVSEFSLNFSSFGFNADTAKVLNAYYHFAPKANIYLKRKKHWIQNIVEFEYDKNRIKSGSMIDATDKRHVYSSDLENDLFRVAFVRHVYKKIMPSNIMVQLDGGKNLNKMVNKDSVLEDPFQFMKLTITADKFIQFKNKKKKVFGLYIKGFLESFLMQKNTGATKGVYNPTISGANGSNDYGYRQLMFRRSETFNNGSVWNNQLLPGGLGMRMVPNILAKSRMAGVNSQVHLYPGSLINIYADAVVADDANDKYNFYYTAGLNYTANLGNNIVWEANLPLVYSANVKAGTTPKNLFSYLNFKISLNLYSPIKAVRSIYQ